MHLISEAVSVLEQFAPLTYQESYDNCGLQLGNPQNEISGILLALDVTEEVVDEAIQTGANLIVCHHPLIFGGIKKITGRNSIERTIIKAISNNIAIYASHTSSDNNASGVSYKMAEKLGLQKIRPLITQTGQLFKLVTFIPESYQEQVSTAIFEAGAGQIGKYDSCSFKVTGEGTFRAGAGAQPFVGELGKLHREPEIRFETIFPKHLEQAVIKALIDSHPYEEVAYDLYPLVNSNPLTGAGAIGELENPQKETDFLMQLKNTFSAFGIRHSKLLHRPIVRVAMCGGSGYSFLQAAKAQKADIFITADLKYHQFSEAEEALVIADIGHYESEQFILEVFYDLLSKNFSKFAVCFTKVNTNPINYF